MSSAAKPNCESVFIPEARFGSKELAAKMKLAHYGGPVVVCVLDLLNPRRSYLHLSGVAKEIEFVQGDVRDVSLLSTVLERFDVETVFHLAAQPIVPLSITDPAQTLSVNANGTYAVLEAIRSSRSTTRLVFASSGAYYGDSTAAAPIDEERAPRAASNIYAASKVAGDIAVRCYAKTYGLRTAACRFINTYGPGDTNFSRIVPRAIRNLMAHAAYDFGDRDDGTTELDYMHVRDMASAYIKSAGIGSRAMLIRDKRERRNYRGIYASVLCRLGLHGPAKDRLMRIKRAILFTSSRLNGPNLIRSQYGAAHRYEVAQSRCSSHLPGACAISPMRQKAPNE